MGKLKNGTYWIRIKQDWKPVIGILKSGYWFVDGCQVEVEWVGENIPDHLWANDGLKSEIHTGQVGRGVGSSQVGIRAGYAVGGLMEMTQSVPFSDGFVELLKGKKG